jgi:hypothetical protein
MNEQRRGFLKTIVAAGTALIVPQQPEQKRLILPDEIHEPPAAEALDLGEYLLLPKSSIRQWQATVGYNYVEVHDWQPREEYVYTGQSVELKLTCVLDSRCSHALDLERILPHVSPRLTHFRRLSQPLDLSPSCE